MTSEDKMKAFLTEKMLSGEEPNLTYEIIDSLGAIIDDNGKPCISSSIIFSISEVTLDELRTLS